MRIIALAILSASFILALISSAPACPPGQQVAPALTFQQPVQLSQQYTVAQPLGVQMQMGYSAGVSCEQPAVVPANNPFQLAPTFAAPAPVYRSSYGAAFAPVALPVGAGVQHGRFRIRGHVRY